MKKRILIIEDNEAVRDNLEETLGLFGYDTISAEDGNQGVKLALENPPDLILCDVMMPKLDGFGVLNILSKKHQTAEIPFVFLTAKTEKDDFRRGMNLGADDYITKPFYKDELLQVIETRLKKSERLLQKFDKTEEGWHTFINEAKGYEELKKLSKKHQNQTLPKKTTLFREQSNPHYLYFIKKGKIKTYKTTEYGKEYIIDIYKEGDFVGYSALIRNEPYHFTAMTMEETEVSLIPKADFQHLLFANRDVASRLIKMLANDVEEKEEQLLHLAYHSVRKRVADTIVLLNQRFPDREQKGIHILRDDLAGLVGTAKESVIRMLAEFKEEGYIEIQDGGIMVLDERKLKGISN